MKNGGPFGVLRFRVCLAGSRYSLRVDDRVLITVSEAARRLGTSPNAINRWIAKGELEAFRVQGRGFRFVDAEHVEALRLALVGLEERRQSHPKPAETTEFRKKSLENWRMTYGEGGIGPS